MFSHWSAGLSNNGALAMVSETIRFLLVAVVAVALLFVTAALLTGCSELKYVECIARDNTSRPCQGM